MTHYPTRHTADGVALLITVLILLVVSLLGAAVVSLGRVDYELSGNFRSSTVSLSLADSALEATAADLRADYDADPAAGALATWVNIDGNPPTIVSPFPDPVATPVNGTALSPATVNPDPYPGTPYAMGDPVPLGAGTYARTIWLPPRIATSGGSTTLSFHVRAEGSDTSRATPAITVIDGVVAVDLTATGAYSVAATLGAGDDGDVVTGGSVMFAGPVTVIGDPAGSTELRLSSFSSIVNGYEGIGGAWGLGALAAKLPPLPIQQYNGDAVAALNSALRLRDADLRLDPLSSLGAADEPGNGTKETLDGVHTDGTVDTGDGNVYADVFGPWDLGEMSFPSLSDPYQDPRTGSAYPSYEAYLDTIAYAPLGGDDLRINTDTASFSYVDPGGRGSLEWDADTGMLTIDGVIKVNGEVIIGDAALGGGGPGRGPDRGRGQGRGGGRGRGRDDASSSAVRYDGTGVLWAADDIEIHADLYPAGRYLEDGPDADAIVDGNLGLMTDGEIRLDSGAVLGRLRVLATLFAEESVGVRRRANVAGSIVTGHIEMSGPLSRLNLWYVPEIANSAPHGMPGANGPAAITVRITDWYQYR